MSVSSKKVIDELFSFKDVNKSVILQRFFKVGKGQYGEGDLFLGISVPVLRQIAKKHKCLILEDIQELLRNKYHEVRLCALLILVEKYEDAQKMVQSKSIKEEIVTFYLNNLVYVNNWDLVDLSCYKILGEFVLEYKYKRKILFKLIKSKNLWFRRVGIVSSFALIKKQELDEVFSLSEQLLFDEENLLHKAVGWMLREAGKRDVVRLTNFLEKHAKVMPRVMLRYSIEKFSPKEKLRFLKIPRV